MADFFPDVAQLAPADMQLLCDAFHRNNTIDVEISERLGVKRDFVIRTEPVFLPVLPTSATLSDMTATRTERFGRSTAN